MKIRVQDVTVYSEIPNPRGYGNWWFRIGDQTDPDAEEVSFFGKYSEAKKKAMKHAAEKGVSRITTLS